MTPMCGAPSSTDDAQLAQIGGNRLLAAMDAPLRRQVEAAAERVFLKCGEVLCEPGDPVRHTWFPHTGLVALIIPSLAGGTTGVTMIGCDGFLAHGALMGVRQAASQSLVQFSGEALRIPVKAAIALFDAGPEFRRVTLSYFAALHAEVMQLASCHAYHTTAARMATFLLHAADRSPHRTILPLTHEELAGLLSAQRTTITTVAKALQQAGIIDYHRGSISIHDRTGLEARACECYGVVRETRDRLLARALR